MDEAVIKLAMGLGLQTTVGWFAPIYFGVVNVLPMLVSLFFYSDKSAEYNAATSGRKSLESQPPDLTFDFIVVGGGSAGSVMANRLSRKFKVLLLERGGATNPLTLVPGLQPSLVGRSEIDYMYQTVPQNSSCMACNNNQMMFHAGKGAGGGSMLNDMVYIRESPYYFHRLAKYTNDERWNYDNVLPFYRRSERLCEDCVGYPGGITATINPKFHNIRGDLPVGTFPYTPLVGEYIEALEWGGVPKEDLNAPNYKPIGDVNTHAHKNGRRVSAYSAFVEPILEERTSLTVVKYARVIQVTFKPGSNHVSGVKYERFGKIEMAKASKEVILSAGTIETPKLLMLSGIGPRDLLYKFNIPLRSHLPVGLNLQNHIGTILGPFLIDQPLSILTDRDINDDAVNLYLKNGTGPFATTSLRASTLWTSSIAASAGEQEWPDIHSHFISNGVAQNTDQEYTRIHNIRADYMTEFVGPVKGRDAFSFLIVPGRPKSRGTVTLQSSDYLDDPLIDPHWFEDENNADMQVLVEGVQRLVYLFENAPSFKRIGSRLNPIPFPPCRDYTFKSEEYWECYVRQFTVAMYHYAGTCAMGPINSPNAVVDSELRVIGVIGLRVIDASVMPQLVTTNPYGSTLMIAERGADLIIKAHTKGKL